MYTYMLTGTYTQKHEHIYMNKMKSLFKRSTVISKLKQKSFLKQKLYYWIDYSEDTEDLGELGIIISNVSCY